jgi:hypothetical protein
LKIRALILTNKSNNKQIEQQAGAQHPSSACPVGAATNKRMLHHQSGSEYADTTLSKLAQLAQE